MHRPGPMDSMDELRTWAYEHCKEEALTAWQEGEEAGMLDFGNEMIRIGPRSKSRIMNKKYATAWIYFSKRSKLLQPKWRPVC